MQDEPRAAAPRRVAPPRGVQGAWRAFASLLVAGLLGGCYYHVMGGGAAAPGEGRGPGLAVNASSGLNGLRGGVGLSVSGLSMKRESSALVGVDAFRLWRSPEARVQPYLRGSLGLLELGRVGDELLWGGASPRAELGLMWFAKDYTALTISGAAEYRVRADGLSTPLYWLQIGIGRFDFFDAPQRSPARAAPADPSERE